MSINPLPAPEHHHSITFVHVVLQKAGVPYEVELQMCSECMHVLDERPLKRAAA
jgi:hypothetical protein